MTTTDPRAAARSALAAHLTARLSGVTVSPNWPTPAKPLVTPSVTVVASPSIATEYHQPRLWRSSAAPTSTTAAPKVQALYSFGKVTLKLQLDAWEKFEASRDALALRVNAALNVSPRVTLGLGGLQDYSTSPGLVLSIPNYYSSLCEFTFEPVPGRIPENSDAAQAGEWRQTWNCKALLYLLNEETVAQMKTATLSFGLNGDALESVPL